MTEVICQIMRKGGTIQQMEVEKNDYPHENEVPNLPLTPLRKNFKTLSENTGEFFLDL